MKSIKLRALPWLVPLLSDPQFMLAMQREFGRRMQPQSRLPWERKVIGFMALGLLVVCGLIIVALWPHP